MKTDKRPFYNWMMVLLMNSVVIFFVLRVISEQNAYDLSQFPFKMVGFIIIGIFFIISVVPVLISKSNSRLKNYFGYGIPILLLLPPLAVFIDFINCGRGRGGCGMGLIIIPIFGLPAAIFAIFYTICIYSRKWSSKSVLFLSLIIPTLIMGCFWFLYNLLE